MAEKDLKFRPLTEGLGFHPFSDGLPYAPVSKHKTRPSSPAEKPQPYATGAGAVAAGQPRFATPAARVRVPVARAPEKASNLIPSDHAAISEAAPLSSRLQPRYGFAYLFKRVLAYILDTALNISACVAALSFVLVRIAVEPLTLMDQSVLLLSVPFVLFFNWALIAAQEVAFSTSVGKRIFGLHLDGSATAIFLRACFFIPSILFVGVGLIWALFNKRKRCWHDMIVDLQPKEVAAL